MGIELPAELADVAGKAGVSWPQADEEAMRESAAAWRDAAEQLNTLAGEADTAASGATGAMHGRAGEAAGTDWSRMAEPESGQFASSVRGCRDAADRLDAAAEQVGSAKTEIVRQLVSLAKNDDAAQQAAAAGHPTALAGLPMAVSGTSANLGNLHSSLVDAVGPAGGTVRGAGELVDPNPGGRGEPGLLSAATGIPQAVVQQAGDTGSSLAEAAGVDSHGTNPGTGGSGAGLAERVTDTAHGVVGGLAGVSDEPAEVGQQPGLGVAPEEGMPEPGSPKPGRPWPDQAGGGPGEDVRPDWQPGRPTGGGIHDGDTGRLPIVGSPGGGPPAAVPGGGTGGWAPDGADGWQSGPADPTPPSGTGGFGGPNAPTPPTGTVRPAAAGLMDAPPAAASGLGAPQVGAGQAGLGQAGAGPIGQAPGGQGPLGGGAQFGGPAGPGGHGAVGGAPGAPPGPGAGGAVGAPPPVPGGGARGADRFVHRFGPEAPGPVQQPGQPPGQQHPGQQHPGQQQPGQPPARQAGGQQAQPALGAPRQEREAVVALFRVHMFPIGHLPVASAKPARQLAPPAAELDYAAGLRFPPHDHPDSDLIDTAEALARAEAGGPPVPPEHGLLMDHPTVAALAETHDPLGALDERTWDKRFLLPTARERGSALEYAWPPAELYPEGCCAEGEAIVLEPDALLDRFGTPEGRVFAPDGTAFAGRSLPPEQLDAGYHRYRVRRPLPVWQAQSAGWFAQPGGGTRYRAGYSAADLVALGYLVELTLRRDMPDGDTMEANP